MTIKNEVKHLTEDKLVLVSAGLQAPYVSTIGLEPILCCILKHIL